MAQAPVTPKPFKLDAGHVALDFVNTLDDRFSPQGPKELLASYKDLLRFAQQSGILNAKQVQHLFGAAKTNEALQSAIDLREAIAHIFYSRIHKEPPLSERLRKLSDYCKEASSHRELCWTASSFAWQWTDMDQQPQAPVWIIAQEATDLLTSGQLALMRSCDAEQCRWLFLDTSKNHTRRWCDMRVCGNRMKARRYQSRHDNSVA